MYPWRLHDSQARQLFGFQTTLYSAVFAPMSHLHLELWSVFSPASSAISRNMLLCGPVRLSMKMTKAPFFNTRKIVGIAPRREGTGAEGYCGIAAAPVGVFRNAATVLTDFTNVTMSAWPNISSVPLSSELDDVISRELYVVSTLGGGRRGWMCFQTFSQAGNLSNTWQVRRAHLSMLRRNVSRPMMSEPGPPPMQQTRR